MTVKAQAESGHLLELVNQLKAGNNVLVLQNNKPVAKLVLVEAEKETNASSSSEEPQNGENLPRQPLVLPSFNGIQVLKPFFSKAEIADELYEDRG